MATVVSFAKVPRWHWSVGMARVVNAQTRIAATSARVDDGRGHSAAGPAEIGAAWKKTPQDGPFPRFCSYEPGRSLAIHQSRPDRG